MLFDIDDKLYSKIFFIEGLSAHFMVLVLVCLRTMIMRNSLLFFYLLTSFSFVPFKS